MNRGGPRSPYPQGELKVMHTHLSKVGDTGDTERKASNFYSSVEYRHPSDHHIWSSREKGTRIQLIMFGYGS